MRRRTVLDMLPWALAAAVAEGARAQGPPAAGGGGSAPPTPTCGYCRERLQTVAELRRQLPAAWQVRLVDEPVLGGQMLTVRAGADRGPLVLLVHGLGQNGFTDWMPVLPHLARRHRVLAVDLPGFGYSTSPPAKLSPTNYAKVLARLLGREATGPAIVVGHSMGGAVALRLAAEHPQAVGRLVLVDAAGILQRTAFVKHQANLPVAVESVPQPLKESVARLRNFAGVLIERMLGRQGDPTDVLRASELGWALMLRDKVNVNAALALVDEDFSTAIHRDVQQPVHLIWGEADPIAPLRTGELLARRLPRAHLATIAGVGHVPMDAAPQAFIALLDQALAGEPTPRHALAPGTGASSAAGALPDLECTGQVTERRHGGRWREVRIDRCSAVRLTDLEAERIVIRGSSVQMLGVQVRGGGTALSIIDSELVATACDFEGAVAIEADASRLDLAGVRLLADGDAVQVRTRSRLVASVSEIRERAYRGWWHEDRELEDAVLDPRTPPTMLPPRR